MVVVATYSARPDYKAGGERVFTILKEHPFKLVVFRALESRLTFRLVGQQRHVI